MPHDSPLLMAWPASGLNFCLTECVDEFIRNAVRYGHDDISFAVSFDRAFSDIDPELLHRLKKSAANTNVRLNLYDLNGRQDIIKQFKTPEAVEALEYALFPSPDGISHGSNTNLNLLLSAGRQFISTDDDIHCRPARPVKKGASSDSPVWTTAYYPGEFFYHKSRQDLLETVEETEMNIFSFYKENLGRKSHELIDSDGDELPEARVMTISPGTYGDSCMAGQASLLNLRGEGRRHMMDDYKILRYSREVVRIPEYNALSRTPHFLMSQSGVDNTRPFPPLPTYGRNADALIMFLTRLIYPDSCTLFPDFGLLHSPSPERTADRDSLHRYSFTVCSLMMAASMFCRPDKSITDTAERFAILGSGLEDIGNMNEADFTETVHSALSMGLKNYARQMMELLDSCNRKPPLWAEDVNAHLDSAFALLNAPRRMFGSEGCGLSVGRAQDHFRKYGKLLACWPSIHRHAASLNLLD